MQATPNRCNYCFAPFLQIFDQFRWLDTVSSLAGLCRVYRNRDLSHEHRIRGLLGHAEGSFELDFCVPPSNAALRPFIACS